MHRSVNRTKQYAWAPLALALAITIGLSAVFSSGGMAHAATAKPTIVLVHGAWANTASWSGVIEALLHVPWVR